MKNPIAKSGIMSISPYVAGKTSVGDGVKPIKLSSNENPYGASPKAVEAYKNSVESINRYPDGSCLAVRKAIADVHNLPINNIICGAGSDELIGLIVSAFAGEGDEVLYSEHGFLMYKIYALAAGAVPVTAAERNLTTDVDAMLAAVTSRTKLVFVANPNNPTGSYINASELERLRDGLPSDVLLVIDSAYAEYAENFAGDDYVAGAKMALENDNVIMTRTFSKIYGLSAVRLGWLVASDYIIDIINRVKSPFNVTTTATLAGAAAMLDAPWLAEQCRLNADGLEYLQNELDRLGLKHYPSVANFVLVDFGNADKAQQVVKFLADKNIYVRDVSGYRLPNCLRITIGTKQENISLIKALNELF